MKEKLARLLREKQQQITDIVLEHPDIAYYYPGRTVRISGCPQTCQAHEEPAADVLINLDKRDEHNIDLIVCFRQRSPLPPPPGYRKGGRAWWHVALQLEQLLGCRINVTTEDGLKRSFPVTYRSCLSTSESNP